MSIILIRPGNTSLPKGIVSTQYPINIGYLASWLKKNGIDVVLLDFEVECSAQHRLIETMNKIRPVLVGLSCMTSNIIAGHSIARFIKERFPDTKIVIGGVHSTAIPERTLEEFPYFDIVVKGEGELTLLELYDSIVSNGDFSKVRGLVYRGVGPDFVDTGQRSLIDNLDILPFPDRDLLKMDLYKKTHASRGFSRLNKNISEIMTARGCPYNCNYCASKVTFEKRVRYRSIENIINEMDYCISKYKTNHFSVLDDTFTFRKDVLYPVCDYLKEKKVTWDCFTRVDKVDAEMLKQVVDSGCEKISFGIESGSERILKLMGKGITVAQIKEAFILCKKAGLRYTEATFMFGSHPLETWKDVKVTMNLIKEIDPDFIACSLTCPFPGTELNRIMKEGSYLDKEKWDEYVLYGNVKPSWKLEFLDIDELRNVQKGFMIRFYLRPGYVLRQIWKLKNPKEFIYWMNTAVNMIKN